MICSRHKALAMVTLYGTAVFAIIRRSYRRKAANKHVIRQLAPDDIISRLPDEILISILSLMLTKDAIRTSILSNRWRNLYKLVPYIDFQCDPLFGTRAPHPHDSNLIINSVDRYLSLRSGHKIHYFYFRCCLSKSDTDQFEKCICCLGRSGVEELFLEFSCYPRSIDRCDVSFSFHLLSKMPSLKFFTLMCCSLNPNLKIQCKFLQSLSLSFVKLLPGALECILSNCSCLQSLGMSFVQFQYPCYKLCFRGPNLQLKSLKMQFCKYFEEIEFYASNLIVFELQGRSVDKFIFDHAPQLESIHLSFFNENIMSYVFEKLAMDLPRLKSLTFTNYGEFYELSSRLVGIETFGNLRRLGLTFNVTPINLLSLIPVLHGCPLLEEFNLATRFEDQYDGPKLEYNTVLPSEMKKVEISGFGGTDNEIEFALYILRNTVGLEQMHIIRRDKFYMGFGSWMERDQTPWDEETRKLIEDHLKGQAVNKTARLIIEHASLHDVMERSGVDDNIFRHDCLETDYQACSSPSAGRKLSS